MTRFLTSDTLEELLTDLANAGFRWTEESQTQVPYTFTDEEGNEVTHTATHLTTEDRIPTPFEFAFNGYDTAIYLGHIPLPTEEGEEPQYTTTFHANTTACEGIVFTTEQTPPATPYNVFAE